MGVVFESDLELVLPRHRPPSCFRALGAFSRSHELSKGGASTDMTVMGVGPEPNDTN
jgi:hypothetical protein